VFLVPIGVLFHAARAVRSGVSSVVPNITVRPSTLIRRARMAQLRVLLISALPTKFRSTAVISRARVELATASKWLQRLFYNVHKTVFMPAWHVLVDKYVNDLKGVDVDESTDWEGLLQKHPLTLNTVVNALMAVPPTSFTPLATASTDCFAGNSDANANVLRQILEVLRTGGLDSYDVASGGDVITLTEFERRFRFNDSSETDIGMTCQKMYDALGIDITLFPTRAQRRKYFRKWVLEHHPDKLAEKPPEEQEAMTEEFKKYYDVLKGPCFVELVDE
jgi:hypothetical protein